MLFATLVTPWDSRKWLEFSDTEDYINQSKIPLSSREFLAPHHSGTFFPRPFTVPLLYKLAGSEPVTIVILQKYIHCLSAWFLVFSLLLLIVFLSLAIPGDSLLNNQTHIQTQSL
jgi:hypothetical protein